MIQDFLNKYQNNEYISLKLYNDVLNNNRNILPNSFNLEEYNQKVLNNEYEKYKEYFANMYKDIDSFIQLDKEQIDAILADEESSLVIAGAGTGKTTTMTSKVKYLVDIKNVKPEEILVMSYTRKATQELVNRINVDFDIPARITTFHSLGYNYIKQIYNKKCVVVDENLRNTIFMRYLEEKVFKDKKLMNELLEIFNPDYFRESWLFNKFFKKNYLKYNSYRELFIDYKKYKRKKITNLEKHIKESLNRELNGEVVRTIKGDIVKSKGEGIIANYLFIHNIPYQYERVYSELLDNKRAYKPDFTIEIDGITIYIEYFGMVGNPRYDKIKERKIKYHESRGNNFIGVTYSNNETITETLERELKKYNLVLDRKSDEEIYDAMLNRYPLSMVYKFENVIYSTIDTIKSSDKRKDYYNIANKYINSLQHDESIIAKKQFEFFDNFYHFYQNELYVGPDIYRFDYPDLIYYATEFIDNAPKENNIFKYVIVDEYQDISEERYKLLKRVLDITGAKLTAVGDDWQSIYGFNGSKIEYIYDFKKYFPNSQIFKITTTYRNSKSLINYAGSFIMKNDNQIKKELLSNKNILNPVMFCKYRDGEEIDTLKRLILKIHMDNPTHHILILGRNNQMIKECLKDAELKNSTDTKITYKGYDDIDIDGMTIHKSKGLTSDEVIVIGLNGEFPNKEYKEFWLKNLFKYELPSEGIAYPEERRLFYVALTRTKNKVYLLINEEKTLRSEFINEMYDIINEQRKNEV